MDYNTDRTHLIIPEYGRNVQKMVSYCLSLEDREERNKNALAVIEVMGNLNPHLRDIPDFKHKLWDQLFIMSEFKIDVDSPYPIPSKETFTKRPDVLEYPEKSWKYKFYGLNLKKMIIEAVKKDEGEMKDALVLALANHMKKSFLRWNRDVVYDKVIFDHLYELSDSKLDLRNKGIELIESSKIIIKRPPSSDKKSNNGQSNYSKSNHSQHRKKY